MKKYFVPKFEILELDSFDVLGVSDADGNDYTGEDKDWGDIGL